ncbi:MAG: VirK protein [Tatlockia sp.]|nr:VirK protein [Tatlockia sp.]
MFKKCLLPAIALFSLSTEAAELKTFTEVAKGVEQGSQLTFVVRLKDCKADHPLSDLRVSVKPNAVMVIRDERVTAANKHFTLNESKYPGTPIIDFGKYNINADGSTELHMTVMDARDYKVLASYKVDCELGKGFKVFSQRRIKSAAS